MGSRRILSIGMSPLLTMDACSWVDKSYGIAGDSKELSTIPPMATAKVNLLRLVASSKAAVL
jgi:hypothetical protein